MRWDQVTARRLAVGVGIVRAGIGVGMLAAPAAVPRALGADAGTGPAASWLTRMVGWREVALGGGAAIALHRGEPPALWLLGQALADAGDALAFRSAGRRGLVSPRMATPAAVLALGSAGLLGAATRALAPTRV